MKDVGIISFGTVIPTKLKYIEHLGRNFPIFTVTEELEVTKYLPFGTDRVAQLAIAAADKCLRGIPGSSLAKKCGVIFGSARGATTTLEEGVKTFNKIGRCEPLLSPTTTAGNIAALVSKFCNLEGFSSSISMTCSSTLHAVMMGSALLQSGYLPQVIVGGAESPLTIFTLRMLEALRIYSKRDLNDPYPCRPFNLEEENTLVLSEGSGAFLLELVQPGKRYLSIIKGLGFAEEHNTSLTGVSNNGDAFYAAMAEASLNKLPDLVIPHAPGTKKGDKAELLAIRRLFGEKALIASLKHETGHTFGASGALGLSQGISYLHGKTIMDLPFQSKLLPIKNERVKSVIVNTAGFLGGAMSCQLTLP